MSDYWIIFAFLTPVLLGLNSIVNKWIIDKYFRDPISSLAFMLVANILFVLPATFLIDIWLPWLNWFLITGLGLIYGLMFYFQLKVLKERDASEVAIITRLKPIVVMVLASLLLSEQLSNNNIIGVVLLSMGGFVVASKDIDLKKVKISKQLLNLLIFVLISSLVSIGRKYILFENDFWAVFYWMNFGGMLGGLLLLTDKNNRQRFMSMVKNSPKKVYGVKIITQITYTVGFLANTKALVYGPVSIVAGIYSVQPFFVLIYSYFISKFFPNVISEDISKTSMIKKLIAVLLIVLGSWLII
jgi:drug/metabolite transporter (DMT)-like permease